MAVPGSEQNAAGEEAGGAGLRDSVRIRRDSLWGRGYGDVDGEGWCLGAFGGELLTMTLVGDGGNRREERYRPPLDLGCYVKRRACRRRWRRKAERCFSISGADGGGRDVVLRL